MSEQTQSFTFEQVVPASADAVYRAFTNATALREWLCDVATTAPREGGRCYLAWNDGYYSSGEFTKLEPDETVAFTWHGRGEPAPSNVQVTLQPDGDATRVRVVHGEVGAGPAWDEIVSALKQAWPFSLENLYSVFSSGEDLRFTQRPMLGITISDFDAGIAERLGVPVSQGICLDGVVPHMGAGAAGVKDGDVIVGVDEHEVVDWASLSTALQGHRAGDDVQVTFYRGPERKQVSMTLSGRPIPEIPQTLDGLAEAVTEHYAQMDADLRTVLDGVGEGQLDNRAAPGAWSAREVLAHLIQSERAWHSYMSDMVTGHEPWYDDWGGNLQARIDATVDAYPSVSDLLQELRRVNAETVAFVTHLPPSFLERKPTYWRLAYQLLETPYHHRTHMTQMREAIAAS